MKSLWLEVHHHIRRTPGIIDLLTHLFVGPNAVERSVEAGELAGLPMMVDFGADHPERPLDQLQKFKP